MLLDLFHVYSHFFLFSLRSLLFSVSLFCSRNLVSYSFWAGSDERAGPDAWAGSDARAGSDVWAGSDPWAGSDVWAGSALWAGGQLGQAGVLGVSSCLHSLLSIFH